ncbi:MAG: sugar phosphate isomerase/epimerase [Acidobacteria bacterium]|nr:sugar phosphate isomerase/epimerase [Acidobacteriota bacterium]
MTRRWFLTAAGTAVAATAVGPRAQSALPPARTARFRTGLVAYSFQRALQSGQMTYEDLIRLAVDTDIDGIDMTVYWLPSLDDKYLLSLRQLAYRNRVEIYSIGTRVQLSQPTPDQQAKQLADLAKWVDVAQKLGASHIRVFGGQKPAGATLEQAIAFAADTLRKGAEHAGSRGITLGVEDDGGITEYAKETIAIVTGAGSPWAGMNLDIGNFRPPRVYEQIELSIPHAVSTHIKTTVALDDGSGRAPFDLDRVYRMFAAHGYRGYMGLEYEAGGEDPATAVPRHLGQLRALAAKYSRAS